MAVRVTVDGRPVVADIIDLQEGPQGWVDIEDLSMLHTAPVTEYTPDQVLDTVEREQGVEYMRTPAIKLPVKRLHGNVVVEVSPPETE